MSLLDMVTPPYGAGDLDRRGAVQTQERLVEGTLVDMGSLIVSTKAVMSGEWLAFVAQEANPALWSI